MERIQLYRQIFIAVDSEFTGCVDIDELEEFGRFMMGNKWDRAETIRFLAEYDVDATGVLDFPEFICFCEERLLDPDTDKSFLKSMASGFLKHTDRKEKAISLKWHSRALDIDAMAICTLPVGFTVFLILVFNMKEQDFIDNNVGEGAGMFFTSYDQIFVCCVGFLPTVLGILYIIILNCMNKRHDDVTPMWHFKEGAQSAAEGTGSGVRNMVRAITGQNGPASSRRTVKADSSRVQPAPGEGGVSADSEENGFSNF